MPYIPYTDEQKQLANSVDLLTSAEDLYEYLAEESEGFSLIAERRKV